MVVEKMSGIYIPGAKIPDGNYVRVLMLHKDGTCVDGIGNVFNVIPIPPHGKCVEAEPIMKFITDGLNSGKFGYDQIEVLAEIQYAPTIIPPSEEGET